MTNTVNMTINSITQVSGDEYSASYTPIDNSVATVTADGQINIKSGVTGSVVLTWTLSNSVGETFQSSANTTIAFTKESGNDSVNSEFSNYTLSNGNKTLSVTDKDDPQDSYSYVLYLNSGKYLDPRIYNRPI